MRDLLASCSIMALMSTAAFAADFGPDAGRTVSDSNWFVRFGAAFDGYEVNQVDNDEGTDDDGWNGGGSLDLALGRMVSGGWGIQMDARGALFADTHGGDDDWTKNYLTGGLHLFRPTSDGLVGAFAGGGFTGDTGDSDESQTYWFVGLEGQRAMASTILFGEIGYLDGSDEYDEGINQAGFGRIGIRYFPRADLAFMAAASGAFGQQDNGDEVDSDALIGDLKLEAEYVIGGGPTSLFTSYEGTFVSFDGGDHQTDFHGFMVGIRWRLGAPDLKSAYLGPGSLDLPSIDRWFAYTANEVE